VQPAINYIEVVTTVASVCAGAATRANIDEYLQTTEHALRYFTGCKHVKAMLNLNPAVPEINMQVTIKLAIDNPDLPAITRAANAMQQQMVSNVPGYQFLLEPTLADGCVVIILSVTGAGDYLPTYAGCLDIITQAAIQTGEHILSSPLRQGVSHGQ
jgi:acetaldehyde dehydrogenase